MNTYFIDYRHFGKCLFVESGNITLGIPLEFGIRIIYLSYQGGDNLFFEQPKDMKELSTDEGWRVFGGHRLWVAPESPKNYKPELQPITYELKDNTIILTQNNDDWLNVQKSLEITFEGDNLVKLNHVIKNTDTKTKTFSPWSISSMAGGGVEYIPLKYRDNGYNPLHRFSTWDYTSLGDDRAEYSRELIKLSHRANSKKYKIGVGHPNGPVKYVNKGVVFEIIYDVFNDKVYPDGDVSFETFMCDYMVEIESLSPLYEVKPNESVCHQEKWLLSKK